MAEFKGNTVAYGGAPVDKDMVMVCPYCGEIDTNRNYRNGQSVCSECEETNFTDEWEVERSEYYDEATAKGW